MIAFIKRNFEIIYSTLGITIALLAFALSVNQYQQAQQLEKLRNKPHLIASMGRTDNKGFFWIIENQGLGAARIKWSRVFFDSVEVSHWDTIYEKLYTESKVKPPLEMKRTFSLLNPESTLHPTLGEFEKIKYLISEPNDLWQRALWENRDRLKLIVCYCSLLDECEIKDFSRGDQIGFSPQERGSEACRIDKRYPTYFNVPPSFR